MWQAFFDSLPLTREVVIEQGTTGWEKIMSPFAAVRAWRLPVTASYFVQGVFSLAAIAATMRLAWNGRPALRNAATGAAVLIATPYVLDYDYVVLLLGIAFLLKDGEERGWGSWERTLLGFAWVAPLVARAVAEATLVPIGLASAVAVLAIAIRRNIRASPSRR